jgi:hypothetical protein
MSPTTRGTHLGVGVTKLDGNVTLELVLETNGLDARDGADGGRLSVGDVTNCTDVDLERESVKCFYSRAAGEATRMEMRERLIEGQKGDEAP